MSLFGSKERIAVFRGGAQTTSQRSMEHGAVVLDVLASSRRYTPLDVAITPTGEWLHEGKAVQPSNFLAHVDGAVVAVLGQYGEDGQLARTLRRFGVPHQAAGPYAALQTWQKDLATARAYHTGIRTPRRLVVSAASRTDLHALSARVTDWLGVPVIVKPVFGTQRVDVYRVDRAEKLPGVIAQVLSLTPSCLIEEYIDGQAVTIASVPHVREQALYHSPVMRWSHQFDRDGRLEDNEALEVANLSRAQKQAATELVSDVYRTLDLSGPVRTDWQVAADGELYFLEANTVAPLTDAAALTQALAAVGVSPEECITATVANLHA